MALPGNRLRQKLIEIAASNVTGAINYDFLTTFTEADFDETDLTLGGEFALQAACLAASKDELGLYEYPVDVIRLELNATWTLSKVEVVVRVPVGEISTLDNTTIWLWWKSDTDTIPAVDADFGQYDVYNPITDSTGTSVPLVTRCAHSFDESPSDASPQMKDRSGNSQHVAVNALSTRIDAAPGRGTKLYGGYFEGPVTPASFAPGLGEWSVIQCACPDAGRTDSYFFINDNCQIAYAPDRVYLRFDSSHQTEVATSKTGLRVMSLTRSGDGGLAMSDELSTTTTGISAVYFDSVTGARIVRDCYDTHISLSYLLYSAPNIHWLKLLSRVINRTSGTIISHASNAVGVTGSWTTIVFDGLREGTEVRVFEVPHAAIWEIDYDGAASGSIGADYVDFDVVTSTTTDRHYIWWTTDPGLAGATGHQVTRTGSETDAQLAALACAVIDGIADVSATVTGTVITVSNALDGLTAKPVYHGQEGIVTIEQIGGTATGEIDGIESSTGTSWTATLLVDSPRLVVLTLLSLQYKNIRYTTRVTTAELRVPAGALQVEDLIYANPS
jgi:hypothetical protein